MPEATAIVVAALRARVRDRRLRVAVLCRGGGALAAAVAAEGHRTAVAGDRFRPLLAIQERLGAGPGGPAALLEVRFDELPLRAGVFDALVLARGLPRLASPVESLRSLRGLLVPGGLLIWVQSIAEGPGGRLARLVSPLARGMIPACPRHELCAWTMAAGFGEIGQRAGRGRLVPWAVTWATAAREPGPQQVVFKPSNSV
jgi:SAM-dependent methyltransferase